MTTEVLDAPPAASQQGAADASPAATLATSAPAQPQQATDGQQPATPAEGAQAGTDGDAGKPADPVPEKYEFTALEGHELADDVVTAFSDVAKELKLTQAAAQQLVDKLAPVLAQSTAAKAEAFFADVGGAPATWAQQAKADKEFGGEKFDANLAVARKAMEFATPQMRALLDKTRIGDHPEMIRWMHRVGKALSEDTFVGGKPSAGKPDDPAKKLFPSMN
ncbi:MAG: protease [Burkholderiales bacterium]|nr:protease [Burkholderiales bacterium]